MIGMPLLGDSDNSNRLEVGGHTRSQTGSLSFAVMQRLVTFAVAWEYLYTVLMTAASHEYLSHRYSRRRFMPLAMILVSANILLFDMLSTWSKLMFFDVAFCIAIVTPALALPKASRLKDFIIVASVLIYTALLISCLDSDLAEAWMLEILALMIVVLSLCGMQFGAMLMLVLPVSASALLLRFNAASCISITVLGLILPVATDCVFVEQYFLQVANERLTKCGRASLSINLQTQEVVEVDNSGLRLFPGFQKQLFTNLPQVAGERQPITVHDLASAFEDNRCCFTTLRLLDKAVDCRLVPYFKITHTNTLRVMVLEEGEGRPHATDASTTRGDNFGTDDSQSLGEVRSQPVIRGRRALEKFDPPEPSKDDIVAFAVHLGIDICTEQHLLWIAQEAWSAPVPPPWKTCATDSDDHFFFWNPETQESVWEHPGEEKWRRLIEEQRSLPSQVREG